MTGQEYKVRLSYKADKILSVLENSKNYNEIQELRDLIGQLRNFVVIDKEALKTNTIVTIGDPDYNEKLATFDFKLSFKAGGFLVTSNLDKYLKEKLAFYIEELTPKRLEERE